jgi:dihydrodipicolinate synthase/N-acetylneuraminate lyase
MAAIHERFNGLFIPHVTPFDDSGALDLDSLTGLTKHFSSLPGVAGLVSCARIGESPVLSSDEKRRVYEVSGMAAREAGKVHIATIAPQSTDEAVGLMRDLENLPVDGVMIFPPLLFAWGKVDPNLKVRFFEDLVRETPSRRRPSTLSCSVKPCSVYGATKRPCAF